MVKRVEKVVRSTVFPQADNTTVKSETTSAVPLQEQDPKLSVPDLEIARAATNFLVLKLKVEDERILDPDLTPADARRHVPLLSSSERKEWDEKIRIAKKIKNLISKERLFLRKALRDHGKRKKTFYDLLKEIKIIESKKDEASPGEKLLLKELIAAKEMRRTTTSNFLDDHILERRVDYDKFLRTLNRVVAESGDKRLIEGIKNLDIIPLVAFMSVKTDSSSGGFLTSLPDWVVTKDDRAGENLSLLGRYVLLETFGLKTARDVEEFEKWDSIEIAYLRKSRAVEIVKSAFPEFCLGTNPLIRPWNIRGARWVEEGAKDLAANACAWFLLHYIQVVKEDKTYDIEKMRAMTEWQKKLVSAELSSMYLNCPDVKHDLIAIFNLGSNKLKELGLVNESFVGIGKNQFRPWDFKRRVIPKTDFERRKARLQMAVVLNDFGLGYMYRSGNVARMIFTKDQLIRWAESLPKHTPYKTLDQLLRKEASTAYSSFAGSLSDVMRIVLDILPPEGKGLPMLRRLEKDGYELVFDLDEFSEVKEDISSKDLPFSAIHNMAKRLASIIHLECKVFHRTDFSTFTVENLLANASSIGYELSCLENSTYKPDIVGQERKYLMESSLIKSKALYRLAKIKQEGGSVVSPQMSFSDFEKVVREVLSFHKVEFNRVLLMCILADSINRSSGDKKVFSEVPSGFADELRPDMADDVKIMDFALSVKS